MLYPSGVVVFFLLLVNLSLSSPQGTLSAFVWLDGRKTTELYWVHGCPFLRLVHSNDSYETPAKGSFQPVFCFPSLVCIAKAERTVPSLFREGRLFLSALALIWDNWCRSRPSRDTHFWCVFLLYIGDRLFCLLIVGLWWFDLLWPTTWSSCWVV